MSATVFLDYTQDELDRAYDQRAWAPNAEALIARWQEAVPAARAANPRYGEAAYGDGAAETIDVYPAARAGAAVHVHIHGGAWRQQSKEDGAFAAGAMNAAGMHFLLPDFDMLPGVRMPTMVDQLARAVAWVYRNAAAFGGDRDRILLSGHSSGAHLAAVLATLEWSEYGLPACPLAGVVCISGAYDLEPVLLSARRSYIDLSPQEAHLLSAPRHVERIRCPVSVLHGERETPEFRRQSVDFATRLETAGRLRLHKEVAGHNHFEMADALAEPSGEVFRAVTDMLEQMRSPGRTAKACPAR